MLRLLSLVVLAVLGLAGMVGGGVALSKELTRKATKAEATAALAQEIAGRWQRLPAGKIFPARISYLNALADPATARLVGIAPPASCRLSLAPAAFQRIRSLGCTVMLRATYVDAAGTLAATVGIAVMRSEVAASTALADLAPMRGSAVLDTISFSGTIANDFGNAERGANGMEQLSSPYLFLYTAGYTDGLPGTAARANPELAPFGSGILNPLETVLNGSPNPCTMKDIRC
jgi:hypothetical protein